MEERLQVIQEFIPSMGCVGYRLVALKILITIAQVAKEKYKHLKLFLCFDILYQSRYIIVVENPMIST